MLGLSFNRISISWNSPSFSSMCLNVKSAVLYGLGREIAPTVTASRNSSLSIVSCSSARNSSGTFPRWYSFRCTHFMPLWFMNSSHLCSWRMARFWAGSVVLYVCVRLFFSFACAHALIIMEGIRVCSLPSLLSAFRACGYGARRGHRLVGLLFLRRFLLRFGQCRLGMLVNVRAPMLRC